MPGGIMDFMLILQIVVLLGAIFLGVRLGGIGIGYAGGLGVLVASFVRTRSRSTISLLS